MSYREGSYKRPAWIGIVVAAVLGLWFFGPGLSNAGKRARLSTPAGFEAEVLNDPEAGELFKTLKVTNPDEVRTYVETGAQKMGQGATDAEISAYSRRFMLSILRDVPRRLAAAPHDDLVAAVQAQSDLLDKARASDPATCAQLASTGSAAGAGPALQSLVLSAAIVRLRGAAAGRDHPQPGTGKVTAGDVRALAALMQKNGLSESDANLFLTSDSLAGLPPQSQCDITYHSYRDTLALPKDQGDRVMRWLVDPGA